MIAAVLLQLLKQESIRGKKWKNTSRDGSRRQDPLLSPLEKVKLVRIWEARNLIWSFHIPDENVIA